MSDALKILGSALLSTTMAAVYTPAATKTAIVSSFRLVNVTTSTHTCWAAVGASTYNVIPPALSLAAGYAYVDSDPITLATAEAFKAMASSAAAVHCVVFGIEHTT